MPYEKIRLRRLRYLISEPTECPECGRILYPIFLPGVSAPCALFCLKCDLLVVGENTCSNFRESLRSLRSKESAKS